MAVYCIGCDREFPKVNGYGYKEVGQAIKDQIPWKVFEQFGPVVLTGIIFGPMVGALALAPNWEHVLSIPDAWEIYSGSRTGALNRAQIPCPCCRRHVGWERRKSEKRNHRTLDV